MMRFAIANQTLLQWPVCSNCGRTHVVWLVSGMDQRQSARIFSPFNNFVQIELLLEVKSNRSSRSSRNCYDECFPIHLLRSLIRSSLHNDGGQCIECVECIECVAFSTFKCNSTTERMLITCFCLSPVQANWRRGRFLLFARRKSCSEWDEALRVTMKRAVLPHTKNNQNNSFVIVVHIPQFLKLLNSIFRPNRVFEHLLNENIKPKIWINFAVFSSTTFYASNNWINCGNWIAFENVSIRKIPNRNVHSFGHFGFGLW